ncbi:hypothetical protein RF11_03284 [Thelohanellus kitauei]|uniref:Uncharacterized protein n=1 Tax=Thelohanellus kitauei TaxID=669202 RepID=A0A0C2MND2_THEKT|nr:hypothetical protein RF11_03284 [Thelohanellus kitauei]
MSSVNPAVDVSKPWIIEPRRSVKCREYSLEIQYDAVKARTTGYPPLLCVARRGTPVSFLLEAHTLAVDAKRLGLQLCTKSENADKMIDVAPTSAYKTYFECKVEEKDEKAFLMTLETTTSAPVGLYHVAVSDGTTALTEALPLFIVFNPLDASDEVYADDETFLDEYLDNPTVDTHFGSADSYGVRTYTLEQV